MTATCRVRVSPVPEQKTTISLGLGLLLTPEEDCLPREAVAVHFPLAGTSAQRLQDNTALAEKIDRILTSNDIDWTPLMPPGEPLRQFTDTKFTIYAHTTAAVKHKKILGSLISFASQGTDSYALYSYRRNISCAIRVMESAPQCLDVYCSLFNAKLLDTNVEVLIDCLAHFFKTLHVHLAGQVWRIYVHLDPLLFPSSIRSVVWLRLLEARAIRHLELGESSSVQSPPEKAPVCLIFSSQELLTLAAVLARLNVVDYV